eukprot:11000-Heterococcus_DN1.PRE.1
MLLRLTALNSGVMPVTADTALTSAPQLSRYAITGRWLPAAATPSASSSCASVADSSAPNSCSNCTVSQCRSCAAANSAVHPLESFTVRTRGSLPTSSLHCQCSPFELPDAELYRHGA